MNAFPPPIIPLLCWKQNHAVSQRSGNLNDWAIFSIIKQKRAITFLKFYYCFNKVLLRGWHTLGLFKIPVPWPCSFNYGVALVHMQGEEFCHSICSCILSHLALTSKQSYRVTCAWGGEQLPSHQDRARLVGLFNAKEGESGYNWA